MIAEEIKIGLVQYKEDGFKTYWKGFLIYKDTPVFEVIGNQNEGQYGYFIPLNFAEIEGEEKNEEDKKADIGILNISEFDNKNGGKTFVVKSIIELFGMKFPVKGFIGTRNLGTDDERKAVRLEYDHQTVDYYESDKYFQGCAEKKKDPVQLITFVQGIDYTEQDLKVMGEAYPEFDSWYKNYIESARNKKVTTTKKMVMPKKIEASAPY